MWPPVTSMILGGWWCVFLAAVCTASEPPLYKKVGDEVVLKPDAASITGPIKNILWKDGPDIAIQWDGGDIDHNRHFQERGKLNISTGELTIIGLTREDSGSYTAEINSVILDPVKLIVISPVPTPTVSESCNEEKSTCILTCDGDTNGIELVTYNWKFNNSPKTNASKTHIITEESSSGINEFICELENPVSKASSHPIPNPFSTATVTEGGLKINTGLTVFICLLTAVLLLVLIHRWKAGMWFFQKASMPWEGDFWQKERQRTDAAESNGNTARLERTRTDDEETPMAYTASPPQVKTCQL